MNQVEKKAYRADEFRQAVGIGKTKFHEEIKTGRLLPYKVGRVLYVTKTEAERWLQAKQDEYVATQQEKIARQQNHRDWRPPAKV